MNIVDIIDKKRQGAILSKEELSYAFNGYLKDTIKDYQMSSLLMAICIKGMNEQETFDLTDIFIKSGDILDLSLINGVTVDKHSTGGVGDKTTLIIGAIAASCGIKVPKMSGRGLGHTGGTIDKLESIPGFNVNLTKEEFIRQVDDIGFAITSQTGNLVPLDKKVYALRDVTGTVSSIPLIASSIMSKKIASGADKIIIDVKVGNGALLTNKDEALKLSSLMQKIGKVYQKEVEIVISYMDIPLGIAIGNSLEILEVADILNGKEDNYLVALSKSLAAKMIAMGKDIDIASAMDFVDESINSGKAYDKFIEMIEYQGGRIDDIRVSSKKQKIIAKNNGHIIGMDALKFGKLSLSLGAGRLNKEDQIDYGVGIILNKKIGDDVKTGDVLCTLYLKEDADEVLDNIESFYEYANNNVNSVKTSDGLDLI